MRRGGGGDCWNNNMDIVPQVIHENPALNLGPYNRVFQTNPHTTADGFTPNSGETDSDVIISKRVENYPCNKIQI